LEIIDFSEAVHVQTSIRLDSYQYQYTVKDFIAAEKLPGTSRGAIAVTSTNSFIYILFYPAKDREPDAVNEIWVFDWNGNPVKKLLADQNIILITAVNDNLIYALTDQDYHIIQLSF
jgi:hypothetical protein